MIEVEEKLIAITNRYKLLDIFCSSPVKRVLYLGFPIRPPLAPKKPKRHHPANNQGGYGGDRTAKRG